MLEKAAEVMMGCFRVCTSDRSVHWACQLSQLFCSRNCMAYLRYMYCNTVSHLLWHQNAWEISLHKVWRWTNVLNHETIKLWFERRVGSLSIQKCCSFLSYVWFLVGVVNVSGRLASCFKYSDKSIHRMLKLHLKQPTN